MKCVLCYFQEEKSNAVFVVDYTLKAVFFRRFFRRCASILAQCYEGVGGRRGGEGGVGGGEGGGKTSPGEDTR